MDERRNVMKSRIFAVLCAVMAVLSLQGTQVIKCGETEITLVSRHFWNMNSLDFAGINLCRKLSYFGNVARFECGWVGTGHKENKIGEKELKVQFFADGKEFKPSRKKVEAKKFEMKKSSVLLDLQIDYDLTLEDGKLVERAKVTVLRDTDLKLLYLFMHPWCPLFEDAVCTRADGAEEKMSVSAIPRNKTVTRTDLASVCYIAPKEKLKATSIVKALKPVPRGKELFLIWNRGVDRKLYFYPVHRQKFSAGENFEYELTTVIERI